MTAKSADKRQTLLAELDISEQAGYETIFFQLDQYTVTPPSPLATDQLVSLLTTTLKDQLPEPAPDSQHHAVFFTRAWLQLVVAQSRLFSPFFFVASSFFFFSGLAVTTAFDGDSLRFLANAAPLLGMVGIFYQFRSYYNNMSELEASCPYTPTQLGAAKLLAALGYDILLCLAASPFLSCEGYKAWEIIAHWLAPLLFTLGIALIGSRFCGLTGGSLLSVAAWSLNLLASKNGKSLFSLILPQTPTLYLDLVSAALGFLLLACAVRRLAPLEKYENMV